MSLSRYTNSAPSIPASPVYLWVRAANAVACALSCGQGKPRDTAHRSLSLNTGSGLWRCYRCGERGKVREAWEERSPLPLRERARLGLSQAFALPAPIVPVAIASVAEAPAPEAAPIEPPAQPEVTPWKRELRALCPLDDIRPRRCPGAAYLRGRGLDVATAKASGARFSPNFMGRPAIVFPLRGLLRVSDGFGEVEVARPASRALYGPLRGVHARYVDGRDRPKARTLGDKRESLFATADAFSPALPALIVTEAPLDALSLAACGYPAVAFCGTQPPMGLHRASAFRRVLLAFDADGAGERAADALAPVLESFGARCERLTPQGAKDWNEALCNDGRDALADWLAARVLLG